jgi:plastocyanin
MRRALILATVVGVAVMPASAIAKTEKVKAVDFKFNPDPVKVDKGGKVKWTSTQGNHDVTFKDGPSFSEKIDEGETTSSLKFNNTGTFKYICKIHKAEGMKGKVKVK